jgi:hypothetical protein
MFAYTPEQAVAFSWVALETAEPGAWRKIIPERLSFTGPGWGPLEQIYGSLDEGFRRLHILPGSAAGLGFAALTGPDGAADGEDARRKRDQWVIFLGRRDDPLSHPA